MTDDRITPRLRDQLRERLGELFGGSSWRRVVRLRRFVAGALVTLALVLMLAPRAGPAGSRVLVTAADIPAGATVHAADVALREWPAELVPDGALRESAAAEGRVLVGAAHAGEPLTDLRLVGAGPVPDGGSAVPIRIADAGVAALLVPGNRVDVVAAGEQRDEPAVLAADAEVLAVLAEEKGTRGRLVMVAMPRQSASRVASAALTDQVTITLR